MFQKTYPETFLPHKIQELKLFYVGDLIKKPNLPIAPIAPTPPRRPELQNYESTNEITEWISNISIFLGCLWTICIIFESDLFTFKALLFFLFLIFLGFIIRPNTDQKNKEIKNKNDLKMSQYNSLLNRYNEIELVNYNKQLDEYNAKTIEYDFQLNEYNETKEKLKNKLFAKTYLQTIILKEIMYAAKPKKSTIISKKGISESFFKEYLESFFPNKILTNHNLSFGDEGKKNYYQPDFIYADFNNNLYIDIEIDEPYVGKNGEAIHFIHDNSEEKRNDFFINHNWFVVRFSEEQVCKYPTDCCHYLGNFINSIKHDYDWVDLTKYRVPYLNKWTKEEAYKMAFTKYRNSYLPLELRELVKNEEF